MAGNKKKYKGFWRFVKIQIFLILLVVIGIGVYYFSGVGVSVKELHDEAVKYARTSNDDTFKEVQTSLVYDSSQELISVVKGEKDVYYLESDEIPEYVKKALISCEDKKFYKHNGIDIKGIIRAVQSILESKQITQGASTITQQLARNVFLTQEKTWQRKTEEIFIALELEKIYSKDKILEYYINNIYFGNGYYGIQAASKGYFNTEVKNLDLSQMVFLCAIPNNPTLYDPIENFDNTIKRRNRILEGMYNDGIIGKKKYTKAISEDINLDLEKEIKRNYVETYTYYCATRALMQQQGFKFENEFDSTEDELDYEERYSELYSQCQLTLYTAGYRIYTSIDLDKQSKLQQSVDDTLSQFTTTNQEGTYQFQGAAVSINNLTGYVEAIVGGRSQDVKGYTLNRAYQSYRQPGSTIKPLIVYTPQLERGYTPDTIVVDEPVEDGPDNADGSYIGQMTLRNAVALSRNTIAWKLFEELTPSIGMSYLINMNFEGIASSDYILPASLGGLTNGVSPVEMAAAYETIANSGTYKSPTDIVKITDADGNVIFESEDEGSPIYKPNAARMMTSMLQTVMSDGTAAGEGISHMPSAGKTGTTNDNKDGWFVGYTYYYTTSVWIGYDMPQQLPGLSGSTYPVNIWNEYMEQIHKDLAPMDFVSYAEY